MLYSPSGGIQSLPHQRFDQTKHRSPFILDLRAADFGLSSNSSDILRVLARSGQEFSFTRDSTKPVRTSSGHLVTLPKDFPPWARVTANDGNNYTTLLIEGASTNEFTRSKELDHADWTAFRLSVTADQATGPDGTTSLDELVEDSTASDTHGNLQDATLTADANYAYSQFFIANTRTWVALRLLQVSAGSNSVTAWFNLSTGAVGTTADNNTGTFVRAYVEDWTDVAAGLYRCVLVGSVGNSATDIRGITFLADADNSITYTGDGSSSLYAGFAQLEDEANFASSFIPSVASALSRDAELFQTADVGFTPADIVAAGGLTVLTEWVELGTGLSGAGARYFHIGGSGVGSDPRLFLNNRAGSGQLRAEFDDGTANAQSDLSSTATALFDRVRALTTIYLDGSDWKIKLDVYVNDDPVVSATPDTIGSTLPAWSANTLTIGAAPNDTLTGFVGLIRIAFATGERSLAYMTA